MKINIMTQQEEEKLKKLEEKRALIYKDIRKINDEISEIKWRHDDIVGKCYCQHTDDFGERCHFIKILSINKKHSENNDYNWYHYVYLNTSDSNATISFSLETKDEIFEGCFDEITEDEFNEALRKTQNEIEIHLKEMKK